MGRLDGAPRAFRLPPLDLALNPVVAFFAFGIIWAFIVACIAVPVEFSGQIWWWKRQILSTFLWLYYLCENVWVIFIIWLCYSRWGTFTLGESQRDTRPEYSDISWFLMMFSTGMGIALFMFGASEPIYHLEQSVRYTAMGQSFMSYNLASKEALMLSYFHFGIHAWVPFALDYIYGWLGDFIDILSALVSFVGVSTLVGFAAIQKIPYIGIDGKEIQNYKTLMVIIWAPCFLAVLSLSGVIGGSR
ncbi:hypothetical protein GUITHDRAFT_135533 [Guillardia theta CCMP2712]|uniref:Uncharacterized protein n=1 Tax=Guillardia theta (strain CCMP2712) TaxID=905079 RepID=L1JML1_GUITC|nr:hypothetical protein GUITHDRAFT_135533 [Guillardia theta CCMP2712]EKX49821.1 hypothetical protein GUITHDRAFT_135533 [Guillardia theta CCMP2712]|eukprot:XP_005836801.1 hypothetical protein GUITHDRAFT_135533 [Guillardia theta CCMP2712]